MKINMDDPFAGIVECAIHPQGMDTDCTACEAEFTAKNAINEQITAEVQGGFKDLVREGVAPPPNLVGDVRLELLIEVVLQDRNRLHFEVEVGRRLYEAVQATKKDLTRQKLSGGSAKGLQVVGHGGMPKRQR